MRDVVEYMARVSQITRARKYDCHTDSTQRLKNSSFYYELFRCNVYVVDRIILLVCEQVQRVDGVILLDWSDRSLERQIQLGAKTGDIDINLARFEMNNYRSNIIPVAQFFDQQGQLHIVRFLSLEYISYKANSIYRVNIVRHRSFVPNQ